MDMQNVSSLQIPEGAVRTIHDKDNRLLWGRVAYNTKYAGDTIQNGTPTPDIPVPVQVVTGEQTITVSGANLYDYTDTKSVSTGVTADSDGWITAAYNNTGGSTVYLQYFTDLLPLGNNTDYGIVIEVKNVSGNGTLDVCTSYQGQFTSSDNYLFSQLEGGKTYIRTETTKASFDGSIYSLRTVINFASGQSGSITFRISVLEDTAVAPESFVYQPYQSQSYIISLGSTELCKIGDYQDYIYQGSDGWYIHKTINKVLFNGTEAWTMFSGRNGTFCIAKSDIVLAPNILVTPNVISYYYEPKPFRSLYDMTVAYGVANHNAQHWIAIRNKDYSDVNSFKTWLASNNTTVYYVLDTPTDTQITDTTLTAQLNAVHQFLTRYGYESTVFGDLPIVLQRDSLQ